MSKIVFKQSYKARAAPSTPGLNVRHLQYIATRPGAVYNPGCGFGLWGKLPSDDAIRIQYDLELAKRTVREASLGHTLYRAVISVGKDDAQNHGLYSRERWEQLVNDKIGIIAKEMDIKQKNLCWCASMHYAKNHPHVHILYWDNGTDPRSESMPKDDFIKKAERIRAEFSRELHQQEIQEVQKEQQAQLKELRAAVQAMCREANPEQALDLPKLYRSDQLEGLSRHMYELIRDMPVRGSLRYAYLPKEYKEKVDRLIRECLEVPELAKELIRYESFTRQLSQLYSNGKEGTEENLNKALEKLYRELGNQVMAAIKEIRSEIQFSHPSNSQEVRDLIQAAVTEVVPSLESYQVLMKPLSAEHTSDAEAGKQLPNYYDQMNLVVKDVMLDARIRLRLQHYAIEKAGIDLESKPNVPRKKSEQGQDPPELRSLFGKILSDNEWDAYQKTYREAKRDLRREITARLVTDTLQDIQAEGGISDTAVPTVIQTAVTEVVPNLDSFQQLKELLPRERIPVKRMESQIPGYHDQMNKVVGDVLSDARIRLRLQSYALSQALPEGRTEPEKSEHTVCGQKLTNEEWDAYQEVYRDIKRELRREITQQLRQEVGWTDEAVRTGTASLLCGMMRLLSQSSSQRQASAAQARQNQKLRSKDKSREAKKDQQTIQSNASDDWEVNY